MRIATYFDSSSWEECGPSWAAEENRPIALLSKELGNLENNPFSDFYFHDGSFYDISRTFLSEVLKEGEDYAICSPRASLPIEIPTEKDAACKIGKSFNFDTVRSIASIRTRAHVAKVLGSVADEKGGILSSSLIWGTSDFWIAFVGFQICLVRSNFFARIDENFGDLVLNLFYRNSSSFFIEAQK